MARASLALALLSLAACARMAGANAFRGRTPDLTAPAAESPELRKALLSEIEEVLGSGHRQATEGRLGRIEAALRPTFAALPKNEHGRLGHSAVRYAMHRLFVQRHAWYVRGLEPAGEAWDGSSALILQDQLPAYVQSLFETRIGNHGFNLHELAVMAATLENLVHSEALGRLENTYRALERTTKDPVSQEEAMEVVESYMTMYVLGANFSAVTSLELRAQRRAVDNVYPSWPETRKFAREVFDSTAPKRDELTFEHVATVIEEIGERYGRWQNEECKVLKSQLLNLEDRGSGRVRLADFYGSAVHDGQWQFSESMQYLRQLGALDESDPSDLRVIIPNYISSPSNCVASSSYYSVCCVDECEDLLGVVEERVGAPEASPAEIAALVGGLSSSTSPANRSLSPALMSRLEEVGSHHGGSIPLHGRLFAQWMHFAYPRECPYPHVAGTTNPQRAEEWVAQTRQEASASEEEMRMHAAGASRFATKDSGVDMRPLDENEQVSMWSMEEQLLTPRASARPSRAAPLRGFFCVAAVASAAVALYHSAASAAAKGASLLPRHHRKLKV